LLSENTTQQCSRSQHQRHELTALISIAHLFLGVGVVFALVDFVYFLCGEKDI